MKHSMLVACSKCEQEFVLTFAQYYTSPICPVCKLNRDTANKRAYRAKQKHAILESRSMTMEALPNWDNLVRCIMPAADIYLPGRYYCANIVKADINAGLVPASAFNL